LRIFGKCSISLIILFVMISVFPSHFSAHAYIIKTAPYDNEILTNSPREVVIQFDESIESPFDSIKVLDASGHRVDLQNGKVDPNRPSILKTGLKPNLPKGTYTVQWRVVSADGHPVEGVIRFQIGKGKQDTKETRTGTKGYIPKADLIIIRWLQYISNAAIVGLLFFYLVLLPNKLRHKRYTEKVFLRIVPISLVFLFVSIVLSLPLQASIETDIPWHEVWKLPLLEELITGTNFGRIWMIQLAMLVILVLMISILVIVKSSRELILWCCFVLGISLLFTKAFTSHAAAQTTNVITLPMDMIHLLAASVWIGSLIGFAAFLPLVKNEETKHIYLQMVKSFYKWGIIFVLVIAATGIYAGFQYIPDLHSLITTDYGKVLLWKVSLFILMLIFAAINFYKGRQLREKGLGTSLWGELLTGAVILILTVILANLPPAVSSPGPFQQTNTVSGNNITLNVTPKVIGENTFIVTVKDAKGQPLKNIAQLSLTFSMTDMDMEKDTVHLTKENEGKFQTKGLYFIMAGKWNVHVHILTTSLESIDTDFYCQVSGK